MNAARPADASGVDVAGCLDGLTDPAVRDLAWLLFSADLLRAQPPRAPLAEPWADRVGARATAQWLVRLDGDPTPLWAVLEASRPTRLGRYAEILLGWFLEHGPAPRLIAANVPLRRAGRTLGECDFLIETPDGRRLHWELAVKCYLHTGDSRETLADFVGPNLRDRFDRKFTHLLDHQLRLSEREEFVSLGLPGPWLAQMFVKGLLFYRAGSLAQTLANDPPALAPGHARGWWVTRSEWPAFAAQQVADGWSVLPRLAWLATRRIAAGTLSRKSAGGSAEDNVTHLATSSHTADRLDVPDAVRTNAAGSVFTAENAAPDAGAERAQRSGSFADRMVTAAPVDPETLLARLPRPGEPAMVAAFLGDCANGYVECSRGFIVPDDWPAQALAFARE
ncbi:DUF1853 family protein [Paraburkholderia dinghuensis]|uniref:DUF1853 family protein n=1 Tax=Paraburkholderia dinghuensis TaxID=2305225 RepID=A0A3N6N0J4_9BURK|nr:DUF1853 family protein [Paraburkholderia dinghuensis]RQH07895.1 DUF1853 family protein [Paraburkholderia dinghuensis]